MDQLTTTPSTTTPTKHCSKCGTNRDRSWFGRDWHRKDFRTPWCKPCLRAANRLRRTGISQPEFEAILHKQDRRCGICRTVFDAGPIPGAAAPRIDRTADGRVRGLLCPRCKIGVSTFQDDVDRLRAAVVYLVGCSARHLRIRFFPCSALQACLGPPYIVLAWPFDSRRSGSNSSGRRRASSGASAQRARWTT